MWDICKDYNKIKECNLLTLSLSSYLESKIKIFSRFNQSINLYISEKTWTVQNIQNGIYIYIHRRFRKDIVEDFVKTSKYL